jgi:flagellar hook assembly protein FlgD
MGINSVESTYKVAPSVYALSKNYPNPFNPTTTIDYSIPQAGNVELVIYNTAGQKVRTLINQMQDASFYKVVWDGRDESGQSVASGIYFYRLVAGNFSKIEKMTLIK